MSASQKVPLVAPPNIDSLERVVPWEIPHFPGGFDLKGGGEL